MFKCLVAWLILLSYSCECSRILAVIPTPSYSHQIAFRKIWAELSKRGHQVTVLTSNPIRDQTLTNLTEIDISYSKDELWVKYDGDHQLQAVENGVLNILELFYDFIYDVSKSVLSSDYFQNLIHNKEEKFDVVLVESFFPEFYVLGKIFNCPVIGVSSMDAPTDYHMFMGNPSHPISHPDLVLPFYRNLNIIERIISTMFNNLIPTYKYFKVELEKQKLLDKYVDFKTNILDLKKSLDLLFVCSHPLLQGVRPLGAATISIGGTTNIEKPKPLPKEIQVFMEKSTQGVIYFSLGTNVKSKALGEETINKLLLTFKNIPYDILWKFEANITSLPKNVMLLNWAPQQDILRHPKTKLFITQGGLQSLQESIFFEIPMMVFPFFGDQMHNAKMIEHKKIGKYFKHKSFHPLEFESAIFQLIKDPKYKSNVLKLKQLILDEPMSGVEKAVWWTEYVIRHKGAKHLANPITELPLYQYYQLDVYSILGALCILIVVMIQKSAKIVFHFCVKLFGRFIIKKEAKTAKNKKLR
ncbi:unnamed protein product [Brassicogethes aeneus]|uniref:UDP-glucuronosyltransferase n=1 Tax=Brassicogethes aeneus TaxID=1431903 RepID=A0A9P0AU42_BRAAE|nr:unnamed protein product [Brassicogethes aeneus]